MSFVYAPIQKNITMMPVKTSINILSVVTIFYFELTADYNYEGKYHNFWEAVYVDNGTIFAMAGDKKITLNKGDIIFHKPNEPHTIMCNGVSPANIFIISFSVKSPAMKRFEGKVMNVPNHLRSLISAIIYEGEAAFGKNPELLKRHVNTPFGVEQMIRDYLELFLINLVRTMNADERRMAYGEYFRQKMFERNTVVADIIHFLELNLYENISLGDICASLNYGKSYICRVFRNITGKTVMQYYTELRITEAKMLMRKGTLSNAEISNRLGFSSPQYFANVFKNVAKMTPGEYKKTVKGNA